MVYFGLHWSEQLRVAPTIVLTVEQENELTRLARSRRTSVRLAQRARIVLLAAQGLQSKDIADQLGIGRVQVARWRERYLECGLQGIERDLPRGAPPVKVDVARLVELTTQTTPEAATHWSTRKMGAALGVSASTVLRHWQAHGLKPHIVRGFKVSRDPKFVEKLEDIGQCQQRHTHTEWLKFLRKIDRETPKDKTLHLIADNYATHKHPAVQEWLARHPRFNMHFTPTSASWLNMVERFFRDLTTERLRRGVFTSVPELVAAINEYVAHHNTDPKPFIWTKSARDILQKVIRANSRLSSKQNGTLH
jgi:transposase